MKNLPKDLKNESFIDKKCIAPLSIITSLFILRFLIIIKKYFNIEGIKIFFLKSFFIDSSISFDEYLENNIDNVFIKLLF